jgi:hypothetical protein
MRRSNERFRDLVGEFNHQRSKGKGKGKGKGKPHEPNEEHIAAAEAASRFEGTDDQCTVCLGAFKRGEHVTRILCNHLFHEECWTQYLHTTTTTCECPNCRGPPGIKCTFVHLGNHDRTEASAASVEAQEMLQARARRFVNEARPSSQNGSVYSDAPSSDHQRLYTIEDQQSEAMRLPTGSETSEPRSGEQNETLQSSSSIKLPDGRLSLVVDLGSRVNVIGVNTQEEFATKAFEAGIHTQYHFRQRTLNLTGVGNGSAPCNCEAVCPIAVEHIGKGHAHDEYKTNVVEEGGADLPAILGSQDMQDKDAVIILRQGHEMLAFPGKGGYKIEWSPGTQLLPMIPAPSGHLVVPCDHFGHANASVSSDDFTTHADLYTDHTSPE